MLGFPHQVPDRQHCMMNHTIHLILKWPVWLNAAYVYVPGVFLNVSLSLILCVQIPAQWLIPEEGLTFSSFNFCLLINNFKTLKNIWSQNYTYTSSNSPIIIWVLHWPQWIESELSMSVVNSVVVFIIYDQYCNEVTILHFLLSLILLFLSTDEEIFAVHLICVSLKETEHIHLMNANGSYSRYFQSPWNDLPGLGYYVWQGPWKKDFKMSYWKISREKETLNKSSWFSMKLLPYPQPVENRSRYLQDEVVENSIFWQERGLPKLQVSLTARAQSSRSLWISRNWQATDSSVKELINYDTSKVKSQLYQVGRNRGARKRISND